MIGEGLRRYAEWGMVQLLKVRPDRAEARRNDFRRLIESPRDLPQRANPVAPCGWCELACLFDQSNGFRKRRLDKDRDWFHWDAATLLRSGWGWTQVYIDLNWENVKSIHSAITVIIVPNLHSTWFKFVYTDA